MTYKELKSEESLVQIFKWHMKSWFPYSYGPAPH